MQAVSIRVRGGSSDELAAIAQRAQAFTNASGTAIALSGGKAGEIICRARAGSSAPEVGTALRVEGTFTGLCIQSGTELLCDDAETDTRVDKAAIRALNIRSMAAIPIKEEGRVVGVLVVFSPTAHAFKSTHVVVLKTMADRIAAYLHHTQRDQAYSPEPLPAAPAKAVTVPAVVSPVPQPAVVTRPAGPTLTHRQLPVVPKFGPVLANTLTEEIDPAPFSQKKETNSLDEQKSKNDSRRVFGTLDVAAAPKNRLGTNVLMIGAVAVVVIAVAVGLSFTLRRPDVAKQPALEAWSSPGMPAAPAPASASAQPPAMNIPLAPLAKDDEPQPNRQTARPKREETVVLSMGPSRISEARDNSAPMSEAPAISVGTVPASGTLSNLASPVSQPPHPPFLRQSALEPVTVIKKVAPAYPLVAKQHGLSGSVVVQGTVTKKGTIRDLQLISGPPVFRDAAFAALKQWVFKPAALNGQAIEQSTTIRLDFGAQ